MYTCAYKCIHVHTNVYLCIQMYTCAYKCTSVYTNVYLCVQMYTCAYKCIPVHTNVHLCIGYPSSNISIYKCVHVKMYSFTNTFMYKCICIFFSYYVYYLFQRWISGQASLAATTPSLTFWSQSYKPFSPSLMLRKIG